MLWCEQRPSVSLSAHAHLPTHQSIVDLKLRNSFIAWTLRRWIQSNMAENIACVVGAALLGQATFAQLYPVQGTSQQGSFCVDQKV